MIKATQTLAALTLFAVASASDTSTCASEFEQCHGHDFDQCCATGTKCYNQHEWYGLCLAECPEGWACQLHSDSDTDDDDDAEPLAAGQRYVVTYNIEDRCENYGLTECINSASGNNNTDESEVSPYHGTRSQDGEWYFQDTVVYEKDDATLKFTVTYGHDRLNTLRKRVVLMRQNGSEYLQYDEVTVVDADGNSTVHMTDCRTERPEQLLHHVKPFLNHNSSSLDFEPEVTDEGIHGHAYFAPQDIPHEVESNMTDLFSGGMYVAAEVTEDGFQATLLVRDVDLAVMEGDIAWPSPDACEVEVVGFEDPISLRADLDTVAEEAEDDDSAAEGRRLDTVPQHKTKAAQRFQERLDAALEAATAAATANAAERRALGSSCSGDLRPWAEKNAEAGISAQTWTVDAFNSVPTTSGCLGLRSEVAAMYTNFESLAKGDSSYLARVDAAATTVMDGVQAAKDMEDDVRTMEQVMQTGELATSMMSGIPYIGGLLKVMGKGLKQARTKVIAKARGQLESFNSKLAKHDIEGRACTLSTENRDLAQQLVDVTDNYDLALSSVFKVDSECGSDVPLSDQLCQPWADLQATPKAQALSAQESIKKIATGMEAPADIIAKVTALAKNDGYKVMQKVFNGLGQLLEPIHNLLNKRMCVTLPIPTTCPSKHCLNLKYPCGVKKCTKKIFGKKIRFPCGTYWCTKQSCSTLHLPCFKKKKYCFTVSDIVNGAMSLMNIITKALEIAVEAAAKKLGIKLPSIDALLPSFPALDVGVSTIPNLPSLPTMPVQPDFPCQVVTGSNGALSTTGKQCLANLVENEIMQQATCADNDTYDTVQAWAQTLLQQSGERRRNLRGVH